MTQPVPELVGLQLAKDTEARARARQVLATHDGESVWARLALVVAGMASGGFIASSNMVESRWALGGAAATAVLLAVAALRECARLRRRLDALAVLAEKESA
jgi:hypothetical protein